jgi:hypothetical protein
MAAPERPVAVHKSAAEPVRPSCGLSWRLITRAHTERLGLHPVELRDSQAPFHRRTAGIYAILEGSGELELDGL